MEFSYLDLRINLLSFQITTIFIMRYSKCARLFTFKLVLTFVSKSLHFVTVLELTTLEW